MERRRIDLVIFDFDGVLVDTADDIAVAANVVLERYGMPAASRERVRAHIGGGAEALIRRLLPDSSDEVFREATALFKATYTDAYDVHTTLYPGASETLEGLFAAHKAMAIVTNKMETLAGALVRKLGVERYFNLVVGPESVTRRKPDPEAIDLVLSRLGLSAERTLMIGDTAVDILAGKAAGTHTCGALYGYGPQSEIEAVAPDYLIRSIQEVPDLVA